MINYFLKISIVNSLPNVLTFTRIGLVPVVFGLIMVDNLASRWLALIFFTCAAITDYFDGHFARLWGMGSDLGKLFDPIADKLLVSACLLALSSVGSIRGIDVVAAMIILCREILLSGLREFFATVKVSLPVTFVAKFKTTLQLVAIGFLIVGTPFEDSLILLLSYYIGVLFLWSSAVLTLYTGWDYFRSIFKHLD